MRRCIGFALAALLMLPLSVDAQNKKKVLDWSGLSLVKAAEGLILSTKAVIAEGFALRNQAQQKNELGQLSAINGALTGIRGMLLRMERSYIALTDATSRNDSATAKTEYLKIVIAYRKVTELASIMRSAGTPTIGTGVDGKPKVILSTVKDMPSFDPVVQYFGWQVLLPRPEIASTVR